MKNIFIALTLTLSFYVTSAQTDRVYNSATYINDVAASEVPRFIELHKKFTDMSLGENRKHTGDWLFRHWYGSGHTFVIYEQFNSMEDFHADSDLFLENINNSIDAIKDEATKEATKKEWIEYRAFSDGHKDEVRVSSPTSVLSAENVNFDIPFVMVVGKYNSSGNWVKMGNAFFDWRIKPEVDSNTSISGGVSYHFMGSGHEVEVWQCYNSLVDFSTSVTNSAPQDDSLAESRKTFWSLVSGSHEDQIYLHIGHVDTEKGTFDLAGKDN